MNTPSEVTGEGDGDLPGDGGQPEQDDRTEQDAEGRCGGAGEQGDGGADQQHGDQPAVIEQVAERYEQQDADGVAEWGGGHQRSCCAGGDVQIVGDDVQQRLRPVQVARITCRRGRRRGRGLVPAVRARLYR
jgi:hypothetical protein